MMIQVLHRTTASGVPLLPGQVVEVSAEDARYLINTGKAREAEPDIVAPAAQPQAAPAEDLEPAVEQASTSTRKRNRKAGYGHP